MEERNAASNPAYPILWGKGGHALQTCLPPLVGGRGTTKWWKGGRRRRHYKKLRRSRHHHPLNPGRGAAHPAAPFRLAALATHPREGGGQVTWRRRTLPSNPAYPILWGERRPRPSNLPFPSMGEGYHALQTCLPPLVGGRGTTKWWKGAAEGGQDRDGASYRCSVPYTLSRFAGLPLKGKRENMWHWILCHI